MPARRRRSTRGFGLLEAVVAMTILAVTGAALFAWIGQNLEAASRLKQHEARVQQQLLAEALLAAVNPFLNPEGERRLGGAAVVRWRSELAAPMRLSPPTQANESVRWRVGLYRVHVQILHQDSTLSQAFEVLQTGLEDIGSRPNERRVDAP